MKTLIISYLPRGERSNTKKLLDTFLENISGDIERLELTKDVPDLFLEANLSAYYKRNYGDGQLSEEEIKSLQTMDKMTTQIQNADAVVLAYPMYNFSLPATVKAYFDSILQKGKTWDITDGNYVSLLKNKKGLIITTSAGKYSVELGNAAWDHSASLSQVLFQFMGITPEVVNAQGLTPAETPTVLNEAKIKLEEIAKNWN